MDVAELSAITDDDLIAEMERRDLFKTVSADAPKHLLMDATRELAREQDAAHKRLLLAKIAGWLGVPEP